MMVTIALDRVLREAVATPYPHLVTRPTGAAVRSRIEAYLATVEHRAACLDFSAVGLVDLSCADEVVAKLLLRTTGTPGRWVLLVGVEEAHREVIQDVLDHHGLAVAVVPAAGGPAELLGCVPGELHDAYRGLQSARPRTAAGLGAALGWPADRAAAALEELVRRRLARPDGGEFLPLGEA